MLKNNEVTPLLCRTHYFPTQSHSIKFLEFLIIQHSGEISALGSSGSQYFTYQGRIDNEKEKISKDLEVLKTLKEMNTTIGHKKFGCLGDTIVKKEIDLKISDDHIKKHTDDISEIKRIQEKNIKKREMLESELAFFVSSNKDLYNLLLSKQKAAAICPLHFFFFGKGRFARPHL